MELDDFSGALGGAIGGLVKWYQEPTRPLKPIDYATSLMTSTVGAGVVGYVTMSVVEWQRPDVPNTVTFGISMLAGLGSAPVLQSVVGLSSIMVSRLRDWLLAKLPTAPNGAHGPNSAAGQQPAPGPPARLPADAGPVRSVVSDQLRPAGEAGGATEKAG